MSYKKYQSLLVNALFLFSIYFFLGMKNSSAENASRYLGALSGIYHVGFKDYHLINTKSCPNKFYDKSTQHSFSINNPKHCDEIWLRIYYPTESVGISNYYPAQSIIDDIKSFRKNMSTSEISQINNIKSYSLKDANISKGKFPIIFFSPGYGIPAQNYENIITNLVRHGYIVVGINSQFINGKIVSDEGHSIEMVNPSKSIDKKKLFLNSISDLSYALEYLRSGKMNNNITSSINWDSIGLLGHSLGAGTITYLPKNNIKAIASLDFTIDLLDKNDCRKIRDTPFMQVFSSSMYLQNKTGHFPYYCKNQKLSKDNYVVILRNLQNYNDADYSMHLNFTDYSTLQYHPVILNGLNELYKNPQQRFLGTGNGKGLTKTINTNLLNFFNRYLKKNHE